MLTSFMASYAVVIVEDCVWFGALNNKASCSSAKDSENSATKYT